MATQADRITGEHQILPFPHPPPTVKLSTAMGVIALMVTLGSLVWTMAVLVSNKADKDTVQLIRTDVEVIKTRQQIFIDAISPGLLKKE